MQGIIQMPSYHTILAVLITCAYRGTGPGGTGLGPVGWAVAALNAAMLLAVTAIGGHYLVDELGGFAIVLAGILAVRRLPRDGLWQRQRA